MNIKRQAFELSSLKCLGLILSFEIQFLNQFPQKLNSFPDVLNPFVEYQGGWWIQVQNLHKFEKYDVMFQSSYLNPFQRQTKLRK